VGEERQLYALAALPPGGDQAFPIVLEPVKVTDPVLFLSEIQEVFLVILAP